MKANTWPILFTAIPPSTPKMIKYLLNQLNERLMMGVWRQLENRGYNIHDICCMPDMRCQYQTSGRNGSNNTEEKEA